MKFTLFTLDIELILEETGQDLPDVGNVSIVRLGVNQNIINISDHKLAQKIPLHANN